MFSLPPLPYAYDALEPSLSATTMRTHHDKHHRKYIDTVNELLAKSGASPASMEELVRTAGDDRKMANNAGQAWNHGFFWESMTPQFGPVGGALAEAIEAQFGGIDGLKARFIPEGVGHFGSGWVWLALRDGKLSVETTHDGGTLGGQDGVTPIIVCDLWEHAYYLDHKNDRAGFLEQWWSRLANWSFAAAQFEAAAGRGSAYRFPPPVDKAA